MTVYSIGVGSFPKLANGVNVISAVLGFKLHVPSSGTVKLVTSPLTSVTMLVAPEGITNETVEAITVPSISVSAPAPFNGFIVTAPLGIADFMSLLATGA